MAVQHFHDGMGNGVGNGRNRYRYQSNIAPEPVDTHGEYGVSTLPLRMYVTLNNLIYLK